MAPAPSTSSLRRLREQTERRGAAECWSWTGYVDSQGYASMYVWREDGSRRQERLHRLVLELAGEPLAPGEVADHACHNRDADCPGGTGCLHRRCLNPAHLERVADRINVMRGKSQYAINARKTHCKRGHPFDAENTLREQGARKCRTCIRDARRRRWAEARAAGRDPRKPLAPRGGAGADLP